jgi:hypothetical protein
MRELTEDEILLIMEELTEEEISPEELKEIVKFVRTIERHLNK